MALPRLALAIQHQQIHQILPPPNPPKIPFLPRYGLFHIAWKLIDTVYLIPLQAFGNELTPSYQWRTRLWGTYAGSNMIWILMGIGMVGTVGFGPKCGKEADTGCLSYPVMSFLFCFFVMTLPTLRMLRKFKERDCRLVPEDYSLIEAAKGVSSSPAKAATNTPSPTGGTNDKTSPEEEEPNLAIPRKISAQDTLNYLSEERVTFPSTSMVPLFIACMLNHPFRILALACCVEAIGIQMPFVVLPYILRWVVGEDNMERNKLFTLCATVRLLSQVVGVFWVWIPLAQKKWLGKTRAFFIGNVCLSLVHCGLVVVSYKLSVSVLLAFMVVWGIAYSVTCLLNDILNEVCDYDRFLSALRREGQYVYLREFIPKFMELPGVALPLLLMDAFGYDPDLPSTNCPNDMCQPAGVVWTIKLSISLGPALFQALYMYVFLRFPLKDIYQHERVNENAVGRCWWWRGRS